MRVPPEWLTRAVRPVERRKKLTNPKGLPALRALNLQGESPHQRDYQPCLIYLHAISLGARAEPAEEKGPQR